uniref:SAM domain-containing protein n=1 Tax=Guillardia theta TaxID=55529 RepID=A0A7S4PM21_GUITH
MNPLGNVYAEGDPEYQDKHLQPLDPIIVEGDGYLYGIKSAQIVELKEEVRGNDFFAIFSGPSHSVALTAAGQVFSWGANDMRQLGYSGAEEGILGIDMEAKTVLDMQGHIAITAACGRHHTIVITESGQIWSWGALTHGQLGIGEVTKEKYPNGYVNTPVRISSLDTQSPRAVACGYFHSVVIDGSGDLWSFGSSENFAHGHDSQFDIPHPQILQSIHGQDFRQIACGASHTIALTAQGHMYVWGNNKHGQLGLGDVKNRKEPTLNTNMSSRGIRKISCGENHSAFLSDRDVFTFGDGSEGALGHGNAKSQLVPKHVIKLTEECRLRDLECGPKYTVALSDLGQMYFWGNMRSTSGKGQKNVFNMPRRFKGLEAIYGISCGDHEITALVRIPIPPPLEHKFKAGIFIEDTGFGVVEGYIGRACSWGRGSDGKLGHGAGGLTQSNLDTPFPIYGPLHNYSITVVACGQDHSGCITDDGKIFTWGSNKEGQLGLNDYKPRPQPTPIETCIDPDVPRLKTAKNKIFVNLIMGDWHCIAITNKKKVYSWGKNKYGQLGLGHTNNVPLPTGILSLSDPLNRKNVRSIGAGKSHSAVIAEDGDVYTWGRGWEGQLGHDVVTEIELEPHIVPKMENRGSSAVACGRNHTVVVTDNGLIYTWGENKAGQLGTGDLKSSNSPVLIESLEEQEMISIACGSEHSIAVSIANEVYGWGSGVYDQLGLGTLGIFPKPQRIPGLTAVPRIKQIVCGNRSTAAIGNDETAYLLGAWKGITDHVQSKVEKLAGPSVRVSTKGTTPDVLEMPIGIEAIKGIALSESHGMVIGVEQDKQGLIQKRLDFERTEIIKSTAINRQESVSGKSSKKFKQRQLVQPFIMHGHGGDPFPDELEDLDMHVEVEAAQINSVYSESVRDAESSRDDRSDMHSVDGHSVRSGTSKRSGTTGISTVASSKDAESAAEARSVIATHANELGHSTMGVIVTWGNNSHGQLGLCESSDSEKSFQLRHTMTKWFKSLVSERGDKVPARAPKRRIAIPPTPLHGSSSALNLPSVLSIACGEFHTVAICIEGTIWSWGRNQCGQLGHGNTKTCYFPTQVVGMAKKICIRAACGGQHTLVLTDANKIYAWGSNAYGQLGLNRSDKAVLQPDIVDHLRRSGACHVLCGYSHSMALMKNEQIYTWGRNDCGQLGLGHYTHSPVPELVTALRSVRVQQIACGYDHCVAFVADEVEPGMPPLEHVYSWGRGEEGQLGHNELLSRCTPRIVEALEARGIRAINAGGFSSIALDEARQVYTWGDSRDGQLGHGDETSLHTPSIVKAPILEDSIQKDANETFRSRSIFVGPNYMISQGLDADKEKMVDPMNDKVPLDKYSWGCNSHGQLGMPFYNGIRRKKGKFLNVPERVPFLSKWTIREMAGGLEHVATIFEVSTNPKSGRTIEDLNTDLKSLATGEFEEDQHGHDEVDVDADDLSDHELGGLNELKNYGEDDFESSSDEDENEKLYFPKQIFHRLHSAAPIIKRLGLSKYSHLFEEQNVSLETLLELREADLFEMGVNTLGARRRIMRTIYELRNARDISHAGFEEDEFEPPTFEQSEVEGRAPLKDMHEFHDADFLDERIRAEQLADGNEKALALYNVPENEVTNGLPLIGMGKLNVPFITSA